MTNRVELITEQKRLLLIDQQREQAVHAQRCLTLIEDPQNPDALESVAESVKTMEVIAKRLEIFEAAISGAEVKDAEDAEAARLAKAADARNEAQLADSHRRKDAREIDKTLITLARQLRSFLQNNQALRVAACTVGECTMSRASPRYSDDISLIAQTAEVNISSPLAKGFINAGAEVIAGLGDLYGYVDRTSALATVEDIASASGDRLLNRLDYLLRKGA